MGKLYTKQFTQDTSKVQNTIHINTPNIFLHTAERVGFYSPDEKWHLRNVTSDLFQWPLTGVAQVPLFNLVAFFGFYTNLVKETMRPPNKYKK